MRRDRVPAVIAAALLVATRRRVPLTTLVYTLISIHAGILMVGGRHTYAEGAVERPRKTR